MIALTAYRVVLLINKTTPFLSIDMDAFGVMTTAISQLLDAAAAAPRALNAVGGGVRSHALGPEAEADAARCAAIRSAVGDFVDELCDEMEGVVVRVFARGGGGNEGSFMCALSSERVARAARGWVGKGFVGHALATAHAVNVVSAAVDEVRGGGGGNEVFFAGDD